MRVSLTISLFVFGTITAAVSLARSEAAEIVFTAKEIIDFCNKAKNDDIMGPKFLLSGLSAMVPGLIKEREKIEKKTLIPKEQLGMITLKGGSNECPLCKHLESHKPDQNILKSYGQVGYNIVLDVGNDREVWEACRKGIGRVDPPAIFAAKLVKSEEKSRDEFQMEEVSCSPSTLTNNELFRSLFVASAHKIGFNLVSPGNASSDTLTIHNGETTGSSD